MSIASEIARLQQAKADLKTAINSKGGNITTERIDQFAGEVTALPSPKQEETRILTPDFSSGNHVIVPTTGKVLRQVTLTKPAQLIPENIKKDVDICGVVGTLESGGASLDRIGIICFSIYTRKTLTSSLSLTYQITSEMLSKAFFTDGEGNWYLPENVSVYYRGDYKGKANTALTLFSGSSTISGGEITFRVGTTPVALLLYYYEADMTFTGINTSGVITIKWSSSSGEVYPRSYDTEIIELSDNFFDDFPYYSDSRVDYWRKRNFISFFNSRTRLDIGWSLFDAD
mgnify:FL=1